MNKVSPLASIGTLVLALLTAVSTCVHAAEPVMQNKDVTESAVINALSVDGPAAPEGATRGFKPANSGATQGGGDAAPARPHHAGPGKANLLVTFQTGSSELTAESKQALDIVAKALESDALAGLSFKVIGHADARGDAEQNRQLSLLRAQSVAAYLVSAHGILPERLTSEGKGSAEPLNLKRIDAPENRRVTIATIKP